MKHLSYISSLLLMLFCSCSETIDPGTSGSDLPEGTPIEIEASAEIPEMNIASSRALGEQPTADELRNSLKINILVFDAAGVMMQYIPPKDISISSVDGGKVLFKVKNIYSSSQTRRLHFVVTSGDLLTFEGSDYIKTMANESTVMPALMSTGNTDVYWGLKEVPGITETTQIDMRLIRNFVKLSVDYTGPTNFVMTGYTVVNRPNKGTVAPYIPSKHQFATFVDGATLKGYDDIITEGYHGVNPAGVDENMSYTTATEVRAAISNKPVYIYERSQSEVAEAGAELTYIIVEGHFTGAETKTYYYKIDIGHDEKGKFKFYDLLRNFQYTINITEVGGPGAETVDEAMKGEVHNNISSSVVMHDLFAISYNEELIVVSDTRVIFTEQTNGYQLRFRYDVPTGNGTFDQKELKVYDHSDENKEYSMDGVTEGSAPKEVDLSGEVIKSATLTKGNDDWYVLNITTNEVPTDARRLEQNIRIYYTGGSVNLGRSVTLMLRQPWQMTGVSSTAPGTGRNSQFTVNFTLPPGLSSSQFPIIMTFESDKQNMYAQKGQDLIVAVGKSSFKGATTDNIMLYEYNIPWTAYDATNGKAYTATFLTNTTTTEDRAYDTSGIDAANNTDTTINGSREDNNGSTKFCIRIANKGMKVVETQYVNITR